MPAVTSAAGLLTLLDDDNDVLKKHALVNLDKVVDQFWYEISGSIAAVEALYEDEGFKDRVQGAAAPAGAIGRRAVVCARATAIA